MKKRLLVASAVAGTALTVCVPLAVGATTKSSLSPGPACVVVNGPGGATVQVGYAPTGPTGCTQL